MIFGIGKKPKKSNSVLETLIIHWVIIFHFPFRKQSGGRGEYARVIGYMETLPPHKNTIGK